MISSFRRALQRKWARNAIWIGIAAVMLLTSFPALFERYGGSDQWIMSIDGTKYSQRKLQSEVESFVHFAQFKYGPYAQLILQQLSIGGIMDRVVNQELLQRYAHSMHVTVSEAFADKQLRQELEARGRELKLEPITSEGRLNMDAINRMIAPLTYAELQALTKREISDALLTNFAQTAAYVSEVELRNRFQQEHAKRDLSVATVALERFVKQAQQTPVSDDELRVFFKEQNARTRTYWTQEERAGVLYEFDPATYGIEATQKDIESYYNARKHAEFVVTPAQVQVRHILFAASTPQEKVTVRTQAQQILEEAQKNPAQFVQLAEKHSQDSDAKSNKGLTDFFKRGQKEPAFELAAFALQNDGDVSGLVETAKGFEIIQRVAKKAAQHKPLAQVQDEIKKKLAQQKFARVFEQDVRRTSLQENKKEALQRLVHDKKAKETVIARTKSNDKQEIKKLFATYKNGFGSYVVGDKGFVVLTTEVRPAAEQKFDEIKKQVADAFYKAKAEKLMADFLVTVRKELATKSFDAVVAEHQLTKVAVPAFALDDQKAVEELGKKYGNQFAQQASVLSAPGQARLSYDGVTGYLIQLKGLSAFDQKAFDEKKRLVKARAVQEQERLLGTAFVASLFKNVTIKFNESINR